MKKLAFVFAAAVAVSFASCSSKAEQNNTEETTEPTTVVEQPCENQEEAACKCDPCECDPCECEKTCEGAEATEEATEETAETETTPAPDAQ